MRLQYLLGAREFCEKRKEEIKRLVEILVTISDLSKDVSMERVDNYVEELTDTYDWMGYLRYSVSELYLVDFYASYDYYEMTIGRKLVADAGHDELKQYARFLINIAMIKILEDEQDQIRSALYSCIPCEYVADIDFAGEFHQKESPRSDANKITFSEIMKMLDKEGHDVFEEETEEDAERIEFEDGDCVMVWDAPPRVCEDSIIANCKKIMRRLTKERAEGVFKLLDVQQAACLLEYADCVTKRKILLEYQVFNAEKIADKMYERPKKKITIDDIHNMVSEFYYALYLVGRDK